jgi:hypothetical protein
MALHTKAAGAGGQSHGAWAAGKEKPLQPKPEGSGSVVPVEYPEVSRENKDQVEAEG